MINLFKHLEKPFFFNGKYFTVKPEDGMFAVYSNKTNLRLGYTKTNEDQDIENMLVEYFAE